MACAGPELDVGADDGLLMLPEPVLLELLELPEVLEAELDEPEVPDVAEPEVPELPAVPEPADEEFVLVGEALVAEPGSASATAPAASTLATPTVAVVVVIRLLPRRRAATARPTMSRFGLFMR